MRKSEIHLELGYYTDYLKLIEDLPILEALEKYTEEIRNLNKEALNALDEKVYAPGKWTVKEILQHLIDWERIFSYRALVYARNDGGITPGHDQEIMTNNSNANKKNLENLLQDFLQLRTSTISLFQSFDQVDLLREGENYNMKMNPLGIGFIILGHQIHHFHVIQERYLPLLGREVELVKGMRC